MSDLRSMLRFGIVSSVDASKCTARLTFPDRDNLVSAELPILQAAGAKNKFYCLPDVGDECVCLCPNNDDSNGGFIIGSFYHDKCAPPTTNPEVSAIKFSDGTTISYDRATHELRIDCVGTIRINGRQVMIN